MIWLEPIAASIAVRSELRVVVKKLSGGEIISEKVLNERLKVGGGAILHDDQQILFTTY